MTADLPARSFGFDNLFLKPEDDPRSPGGISDERTLLVEYLHDYRLTLEMKCGGLDAEALARRSVPPSNLSLLGLVRHMAEVERTWFRQTLAGEDAPRIYGAEGDRDADFDGAVADPAVVEQAWTNWRDEVGYAERFVAAAADLAVTGRRNGQELNLREILLHMIEEYARHCGHADLLRERIDGRVGL